MYRLTKKERQHRAAILRLRLEHIKFVRRYGLDLDLGDVWAAVALGRYENRPIKINDIVKMTGLPRQTVANKLKTLHERGWVHEVTSGRNRLQILPDNVLFMEMVVEYFQERTRKITETADALKMGLFVLLTYGNFL